MTILSAYPPVLLTSSFQAVKRGEGNNIQIQYQDYAGNKEFNKVQVACKEAETGIRIELNIEPQEKTGLVKINSTNNALKDGKIYSGQIRFVNKDKTQASEWSSNFLFKILCGENESIKIFDSIIGTNPVYQGQMVYDQNDNEVEELYRFLTYDKNQSLVDDSTWLYHKEEIDSYSPRISLQSGERYVIEYHVQSKNKYLIRTSKPYYAIDLGNTELAAASLEVSSDPEEGTINVDISGVEPGWVLVLSRAAADSNYSYWTDIHEFIPDSTSHSFTDFTPESGIEYKYSLQKIQTSSGVRSMRITSKSIAVYLNYAYLWDGEVQLKLKYNNKLSSYKHTVLAQKQDTLGGKYPIIYRNGQVDYREFPITGLISLHLDENQNFMKLKPGKGYYYKNELVIPIEKFGLVDNDKFNPLGFTTNLTQENIFIERKFREKVEEFLYSNTVKLYRSPTEGNVLVSLFNISFTPNQQLGRMIFEFTSTAYEVNNSDLIGLAEVGMIYPVLDDITSWTEKIGNNIWSQLIIESDKFINISSKLDGSIKSFTIHRVEPVRGKSIEFNGVVAESDFFPEITYYEDFAIKGYGIIYYSAEIKSKTQLVEIDNIENYETKYYIGQITTIPNDKDILANILSTLTSKSFDLSFGYTIAKISIEVEGDSKFIINEEEILVSDAYYHDGIEIPLHEFKVSENDFGYTKRITYEVVGYARKEDSNAE